MECRVCVCGAVAVVLCHLCARPPGAVSPVASKRALSFTLSYRSVWFLRGRDPLRVLRLILTPRVGATSTCNTAVTDRISIVDASDHSSSITQGGHHIIARGSARTLCAIADPMRREMRAARHHCGMCGRDWGSVQAFAFPHRAGGLPRWEAPLMRDVIAPEVL